ncbi:unnamed protein product, partial [Closterium sp. Yama58-4]
MSFSEADDDVQEVVPGEGAPCEQEDTCAEDGEVPREGGVEEEGEAGEGEDKGEEEGEEVEGVGEDDKRKPTGKEADTACKAGDAQYRKADGRLAARRKEGNAANRQNGSHQSVLPGEAVSERGNARRGGKAAERGAAGLGRDGPVQVTDVLVGENAAARGVAAGGVAAGGAAAGGAAAEGAAAGNGSAAARGGNAAEEGGSAGGGNRTRVTGAVFGKGAFQATWGSLQQRIDLQQWVKTSTALHRYNAGQEKESAPVEISPVQITPAGAGMTCKLPTSVVVTGSLDCTDSASFCSALQSSLQRMCCCHVALLEPHSFGGGGQAESQAVLSVQKQLTGKAGKVPDMATLSAWRHQTHTSDGGVGSTAGFSDGGVCSIAVVVADAPACSTSALHALISVLRSVCSMLSALVTMSLLPFPSHFPTSTPPRPTVLLHLSSETLSLACFSKKDQVLLSHILSHLSSCPSHRLFPLSLIPPLHPSSPSPHSPSHPRAVSPPSRPSFTTTSSAPPRSPEGVHLTLLMAHPLILPPLPFSPSVPLASLQALLHYHFFSAPSHTTGDASYPPPGSALHSTAAVPPASAAPASAAPPPVAPPLLSQWASAVQCLQRVVQATNALARQELYEAERRHVGKEKVNGHSERLRKMPGEAGDAGEEGEVAESREEGGDCEVEEVARGRETAGRGEGQEGVKGEGGQGRSRGEDGECAWEAGGEARAATVLGWLELACAKLPEVGLGAGGRSSEDAGVAGARLCESYQSVSLSPLLQCNHLSPQPCVRPCCAARPGNSSKGGSAGADGLGGKGAKGGAAGAGAASMAQRGSSAAMRRRAMLLQSAAAPPPSAASSHPAAPRPSPQPAAAPPAAPRSLCDLLLPHVAGKLQALLSSLVR